MSKPAVSVVGLGRMGGPMARNLIAKGFDVTVFNRSPVKAEALASAGASVANTISEAARPGGALMTMLTDDAAVEAACTGRDGIAERLGAGGLHVSCSTISPPAAERLTRLHAASGCEFVCAPVNGRGDLAEAAKLIVWLAGPAGAKARAMPMLQAVSMRVFDLGEQPRQAAVAKLALNFMMFGSLAVFAETLVFAEKAGVAPGLMAECLTETVLASPFFRTFAPGLAGTAELRVDNGLAIAVKDLGSFMRHATAMEMPAPIGAAIHAQYVTSAALGRAAMEASVIALTARENAGIVAR